jgi:hypothetical protein
MLQFPYMARPIKPPPPPNHLPGTIYRYRPIVPVTLVGPANRRHGTYAIVDTGSDDCLFPEGFLTQIGATPFQKLATTSPGAAALTLSSMRIFH